MQTLDSILDTYRTLLDLVTIWYATWDHAIPGKVLIIPESTIGPEFLICHPDDLDSIQQAAPHLRFRHVREWRPRRFHENGPLAVPPIRQKGESA